jgi:two-component sensor histidine kinase
MWLAKRSWSFVVHGTVQAALTAAITRLSSADELEPYQLNMVLQDLDRAREALTKTPTIEVDLASALSAVVSTWQGICAVSVQISPRAQRALDRDVNARMCVNEIVKETVSNAVRHGEAKQAWVEVDRLADEALMIRVRNDGRPVAGELEHGVGTRMLDDLTLDWSLVNNRARGTVDFEANLPISILSA